MSEYIGLTPRGAPAYVLLDAQRADADEQLDYNLPFRWFDKPVWNHAVLSKNRGRLLNEAIAREFLAAVSEQVRSYLSQGTR